MDINKNTNVADVTLAEIHTALFKVESAFGAELKKGNLKEAIELAKRYIELNNLLLKRSSYVRKNGTSNDSLAGVQQDVAKTVSEIIDEKGRNR